MKKISVFAPMGTLDHQPGIMNAIHCFSKYGYLVEVFTVRNTLYPEPKFMDGNIKVYYMPFKYSVPHPESKFLVTISFILWIFFTSPWYKHEIIFAGGIRGLFTAYFYSFFRKTLIINYQAELYLNQSSQFGLASLFKLIERRAAQSSWITIEHDETRCELLCQDLMIDKNKIIVVPNAPCGPAYKKSSYYLHHHLSVDNDYKIILSPGTLSESFETSRIVRISQNLDNKWYCVIHSVHPFRSGDPYIEELKKLNSKNRVLFSLSPVPYSKVDEIMGSARIGLVLYSKEIDQNISSVGLSSGKLSHFLKLGIPVIVSNLPGLSDFVRKYKVGEVLENDGDLNYLIDCIDSKFDEYRENCIRCFDEHLAYENSFKKVIHLIEVRKS